MIEIYKDNKAYVVIGCTKDELLSIINTFYYQRTKELLEEKEKEIKKCQMKLRGYGVKISNLEKKIVQEPIDMGETNLTYREMLKRKIEELNKEKKMNKIHQIKIRKLEEENKRLLCIINKLGEE